MTQIEKYDMVTETRTGIVWVATETQTPDGCVEVVRRGELGKVYNVLRAEEVTVTR